MNRRSQTPLALDEGGEPQFSRGASGLLASVGGGPDSEQQASTAGDAGQIIAADSQAPALGTLASKRLSSASSSSSGSSSFAASSPSSSSYSSTSTSSKTSSGAASHSCSTSNRESDSKALTSLVSAEKSCDIAEKRSRNKSRRARLDKQETIRSKPEDDEQPRAEAETQATLSFGATPETCSQQQQHQHRPSVVLLGNELLQLAHQAAAPSALNLKRSIVGKSSTLLHSLRRHYNSFTATTLTGATTTIETANASASANSQSGDDNDDEGSARHTKEDKEFEGQFASPHASGDSSRVQVANKQNENSRNINDELSRFSTNLVTKSQSITTIVRGKGELEEEEVASCAQSRAREFFPLEPVVTPTRSSSKANEPEERGNSDKEKGKEKNNNNINKNNNNNGDDDQEEAKVSGEEMQQSSKCSSRIKQDSTAPELRQSGGPSPKPPIPPPPQLQKTPTKMRAQANPNQSQLINSTSSAGSQDNQVTSSPTCTATFSFDNNNNGQTASSPYNDNSNVAPKSPFALFNSSANSSVPPSPLAGPRRHAILAQSFERDAILSLKARDLKHKRTSSIKSALRHAAHLGPLKLSFGGGSSASGSESGGVASGIESTSSTKSLVLSKQKHSSHLSQQRPYELFEPPITHRSVQRSKRRGAMMASDARRQMSADTIGLRQLTDEYLANAGVLAKKPLPLTTTPTTTTTSVQSTLSGMQADQAAPATSADSSSQSTSTSTSAAVAASNQPGANVSSQLGSLVALSGPSTAPSAIATAASPAGAGSVGIYGTQPQYSILEAQLFQATRRQQQHHHNQPNSHSHHRGSAFPFKTARSMIETHCRTRSNSDDSMGVVGSSSNYQQYQQHQVTNIIQANNTNNNNNTTHPMSSGSGSASSIQQQHQHHFQHFQNLDSEMAFRAGENNICTSLPGSLPWHTDVSIQCELLPAPPLVEPYETTGDILSTIARPYPGVPKPLHRNSSKLLRDNQAESLDHNHHHQHQASGHNMNQLSATLRKGLSAISQHHLAPGGLSAQEVAQNVVGSLKKSLSNTLDVTNRTSHTPSCLYSQDSLPAYSSFQNEPDDLTLQQQQQQLAKQSTKLSRQSSTKLMVNTAVAAVGKKVGLQRALSFDCRGGYNKQQRSTSQQSQHQDSADSANSTQSANQSSCGKTMLSVNQPATAGNSTHHKSTQSMTNQQERDRDANNNFLPRPYIPQSASQVDFQVPLLPYDRMQEALVSNRLLGPNQKQQQQPPPQMLVDNNNTNNNNNKSDQQQQHRDAGLANKQQPNLDELICVQTSSHNEINFDQQAPIDSMSHHHQLDHHQQHHHHYNEAEQRRQSPPKLLLANDSQEAHASSASATTTTKIGAVQFNAQVAQQQRDCRTTSATDASCPAASGSAGRNSGNVPRLSHDSKQFNVYQQDANQDLSSNLNMLEPRSGQTSVTFNLLVPPGGSGAGGGAGIPNSPSFSISPDGKTSSLSGHSGQLTASEIFSGSNQLIKRPSTMLAADVMTEFAQALSSSGSAGAAQQQQHNQHHHRNQSQNLGSTLGLGRNRRQAIVPPKLATDPDNDDDDRDRDNDYCDADYDNNNNHQRGASEHRVCRLVDISDDASGTEKTLNDGSSRPPSGPGAFQRRASADELTFANARRKRSGGDPIGHKDKQSKPVNDADVQINVPYFTINDHDEQEQQHQSQEHTITINFNDNENNHAGNFGTRPSSALGAASNLQSRPDSQMTNPESFASSSASSLCKREFNQASGGLTVAFDSFRDRRRSSIAIIPQMQICPGDLLVYSKQLIERMNQTDETSETPEFLTIDGKKGKNIWSSFKLFDNRSIKARHEYLCNLDEVLNTLQPSTFVDEQLSHYKGMVWSEFLIETENRRSASSEALAALHSQLQQQEENNNNDDNSNFKLVDLRLSDDESASQTGDRVRNVSSDVEGDNSRSDNNPQQQAGAKIALPNGKSNSNSIMPSSPAKSLTDQNQVQTASSSRSGSMKMLAGWSIGRSNRGSVKGQSQKEKAAVEQPSGLQCAISSSNIQALSPSRKGEANSGCDQASPLKSLGRFKEKPKLRRGQTVDSVFRIPLVPSSPLKHALHHQQTPTAHLENQDHLITTIEDDFEQENKPAPSRATASSQPKVTDVPTVITTPSGDKNNNKNNKTNPSIDDKDLQQQQQQQHSRNHSHAHKSGSFSGRRATAERASFRNSIQAGGGVPLLSNNNNDLETSFDCDSCETLDFASGRSSSGFQTHMHQKQLYNQNQRRQMMRQSSLSTLSSTVTRTEQKRQRALWDLFQSECTFFFDHLMTLKNVYMEPLKKIQVEGFAMQADPDVLFGNLDELCCGVYDFCKEFLQIIIRTLRHQPEELNATDVLIKLYKHNPKIEHLRGIYHRYTLNYINALTYLDSLRRQVEFVEFEKWSSRDSRCKKLQLTDLLVAPVQHIMRVPIILKDIESHTEDLDDKKEIRAILSVEEASLRELDDKMRWLKNFERLLEIQKNIIWPSVVDLEPKVFVPEFLREVLSKQPCEKLIVSPRRQIVHEGTLSNFDSGKSCDMHVILFDDMLLFTRRKKGLTKRTSNVCRTNTAGPSTKDDGSFKYIVYKHPLSLDRIYVHDVPPADSQAMGIKNVILIVVLNRFQQITTLHWFSAPNEDIKQTWQYKMKKTMDRWKKLGNDADGRRSETFGGHEMTLQEQIQQSMDAEASQVPVELLHNWIDRRNRNSRTAMRTPNQQQPQLNANRSINNNSGSTNQMIHDSQQQPQHHQQQANEQATNWRYSGGESESRGGGSATSTTTITNAISISQSQVADCESKNTHITIMTNNENNDNYNSSLTNQCLVNIRSSPNSPERLSQAQLRQADFSQMRINYNQDHDLQPIVGHSIELKITNASVNSDENLDFLSQHDETSIQDPKLIIQDVDVDISKNDNNSNNNNNTTINN